MLHYLHIGPKLFTSLGLFVSPLFIGEERATRRPDPNRAPPIWHVHLYCIIITAKIACLQCSRQRWSEAL